MEIVEIQNIPTSQPTREWDMAVDVAVDSDNISGTQNVVRTKGYELRLMF
jgi:hypothetical protein